MHHRSKGMGRIGPKSVHVKGALGVGKGRKGMTAKHTVSHPGGFGYHGRSKKR